MKYCFILIFLFVSACASNDERSRSGPYDKTPIKKSGTHLSPNSDNNAIHSSSAGYAINGILLMFGLSRSSSKLGFSGESNQNGLYGRCYIQLTIADKEKRASCQDVEILILDSNKAELMKAWVQTEQLEISQLPKNAKFIQAVSHQYKTSSKIIPIKRGTDLKIIFK